MYTTKPITSYNIGNTKIYFGKTTPDSNEESWYSITIKNDIKGYKFTNAYFLSSSMSSGLLKFKDIQRSLKKRNYTNFEDIQLYIKYITEHTNYWYYARKYLKPSVSCSTSSSSSSSKSSIYVIKHSAAGRSCIITSPSSSARLTHTMII
jgi:hypothetical protein